MMKFEWFELDASVGDGPTMWQLHMVSTNGHGKLNTWGILGTLTKLNRAWRIMARRPDTDPDFYWLDNHLTLDEAQRAAKLFLCVGRSGVVGGSDGKR